MHEFDSDWEILNKSDAHGLHTLHKAELFDSSNGYSQDQTRSFGQGFG